MNVIAAVKALLRNEEKEAKQLLGRAFERVGLAVPELTPQELVLKLTESVAEMDPTKAGFARKIEELHREVFD
jgi:flagellar motility protein MotE (MotC chaperone)